MTAITPPQLGNGAPMHAQSDQDSTPGELHRVRRIRPFVLSRQPRRTQAVALGLTLVTSSAVAQACPKCATGDEVWAQILDSSPGATLGVLSLAFSVVVGLVVVSARLMPTARVLVGGCLLLGASLGAFFDGIVLHQVLQWHAMISSKLPPVDLVSSKVNMFWDGVFHLYCWLATIAALVLIFRELSRFGRTLGNRVLAGAALTGWGYFNVVEGVIDHHVFGLHHVHPGVDQALWDGGFLASGALLIGIGARMAVPILRRST